VRNVGKTGEKLMTLQRKQDESVRLRRANDLLTGSEMMKKKMSEIFLKFYELFTKNCQ
jgi:hypothetical protein